MPLIDVPLDGQNLNETRIPINSNFRTINNAFLVDHVVYNATGAGKHNKVTLPNQASVPAFTQPDAGFYNFISPVTNVNELFLVKSNGGNVPITAVSTLPTGWCYLPSGLLLKWGTIAANRNTLSTIVFPTPVNATNGPAFSTVLMVQATQTFGAGPTLTDLNTSPIIGNITATNFQVYPRAITNPTGGAVSITYFALGF